MNRRARRARSVGPGVAMVLAALAGSACERDPTVPARTFVLEDGDGPIEGARVAVGELSALTDEAGTARLAAASGAEIVIASDEHCRRTVRLPAIPPALLRVHLTRRIDLGPDRGQVGFDAEVTLDARLGCADPGARVRWERVEGDAAEGAPRAGAGRRLSFRTVAFPRATLARIDLGIVPISPRTQGRVVWRAVLEERGRPDASDTVTVTSAARLLGVPSVPVGADVYLAAPGEVTVTTRAPRSTAEPVPAGEGLVRFRPDQLGRYVLQLQRPGQDPRDIVLRAGRFDDTPLDCGRSTCHTAESATTPATRMTTFLARALGGRIDPDRMAAYSRPAVAGPPPPPSPSPTSHARGRYPAGACLRCHAVGVEEGVDLGGFDDVLRGVGFKPGHLLDPSAWSRLPRDARRLAGVGCLACHGPGAIPEPSARPLIYRADICASCHDAPPRYAHVATWRETAMASTHRTLERAAARVAVEPECLACHTTAGYVAHDRGRPPPPAEQALLEGVACAACHEPHRSERVAQLRAHGAGEGDDGPVTGLGSGAVCVGCHRAGAPGPGEEARAPAAGQLAMLVGRGGLRADGGALPGPTPHLEVPDTCVGCHVERGGGAAGAGTGGGHGFAAPVVAQAGSRPDARCVRCHDSTGTWVPAQRDVETQLHDTQVALDSAVRAASPASCNPAATAAHRLVVRGTRFAVEDAEGRALGDCDGDGVLAAAEQGVPAFAGRAAALRAAWNLALVERDRSRGMHNPSYARALLEAARQALVP